jgi:hypothetical protein
MPIAILPGHSSLGLASNRDTPQQGDNSIINMTIGGPIPIDDDIDNADGRSEDSDEPTSYIMNPSRLQGMGMTPQMQQLQFQQRQQQYQMQQQQQKMQQEQQQQLQQNRPAPRQSAASASPVPSNNSQTYINTTPNTNATNPTISALTTGGSRESLEVRDQARKMAEELFASMSLGDTLATDTALTVTTETDVERQQSQPDTSFDTNAEDATDEVVEEEIFAAPAPRPKPKKGTTAMVLEMEREMTQSQSQSPIPDYQTPQYSQQDQQQQLLDQQYFQPSQTTYSAASQNEGYGGAIAGMAMPYQQQPEMFHNNNLQQEQLLQPQQLQNQPQMPIRATSSPVPSIASQIPQLQNEPQIQNQTQPPFPTLSLNREPEDRERWKGYPPPGKIDVESMKARSASGSSNMPPLSASVSAGPVSASGFFNSDASPSSGFNNAVAAGDDRSTSWTSQNPNMLAPTTSTSQQHGQMSDPAAPIGLKAADFKTVIFTSYLFKQNRHLNYQKRIFRLDGLHFVCLTTKKAKFGNDQLNFANFDPVRHGSKISQVSKMFASTISKTTPINPPLPIHTSPLLAPALSHSPFSSSSSKSSGTQESALPDIYEKYYLVPKFVIPVSQILRVRSLIQHPPRDETHKLARTFIVEILINEALADSLQGTDSNAKVKEIILQAPTVEEYKRWTFLLSRVSRCGGDDAVYDPKGWGLNINQAQNNGWYGSGDGDDSDDDNGNEDSAMITGRVSGTLSNTGEFTVDYASSSIKRLDVFQESVKEMLNFNPPSKKNTMGIYFPDEIAGQDSQYLCDLRNVIAEPGWQSALAGSRVSYMERIMPQNSSSSSSSIAPMSPVFAQQQQQPQQTQGQLQDQERSMPQTPDFNNNMLSAPSNSKPGSIRSDLTNNVTGPGGPETSSNGEIITPDGRVMKGPTIFGAAIAAGVHPTTKILGGIEQQNQGQQHPGGSIEGTRVNSIIRKVVSIIRLSFI